MAQAMDESNQWHTIEKVLECPVCLEIPQVYIFQCSTGHHICVECRHKVLVCPICKARFLETRNFLAEDMANKLGDIKLSIENQIQNIILDSKKESRSTCTQTDRMVAKSTSAIQTGEVARTNIENRRVKGTAPSAVSSYPCHIGSCMFKSSYRGLLQHMGEYHKDTFYEVHEIHGQFTETCTMTTNALPQCYDFAFLKNGKDLFFFNISVYGNGSLKAHVLLAKAEIAHLFHYDLEIKNGAFQFTRHGKVIPCGGSPAMVCSNSVWIKSENLFKNTMAKLVKISITIRRCACKQFGENVAAVNP